MTSIDESLGNGHCLRLRFDACQLDSGVLLFAGEPVTGMVAKFATDHPDLDPLQVTLHAYEDGSLVGPYVDPVLGLDLSYCWDAAELWALEGDDSEPDLSGLRGSTVHWKDSFVIQIEEQPAPGVPESCTRALMWFENGDRKLVADVPPFAAGVPPAEIRWMWHPNGQLASSTLRYFPGDSDSLVRSDTRFDERGRIAAIEIGPGFDFDFAARLAGDADHWVIHSPDALSKFELSDDLMLNTIDPAVEADVIEALNTAGELDNVRQLTVANEYISLAAAQQLAHLPNLTHLNIKGTTISSDERRLFASLHQIAMSFMERNPQAATELNGLSLLPEPHLDAALGDRLAQAYICDRTFKHLIAVKGHGLKPYQLELARHSPSVRHVHESSSRPRNIDELKALKAHRPDIDIRANGEAINRAAHN